MVCKLKYCALIYFIFPSFKLTLFCDLDLNMLFAISRHLPCMDYMKWNKGVFKYYRVWPVHVRMRLIVYCLNCTCADAKNGWTLILWGATILHSWRKWGLYTSHPTLFYLFYVCAFTEEGLALCNTDTLSVWTVCMCCIILPLHATSSEKTEGLCWTAPSPPITYYKEWKDVGLCCITLPFLYVL